MHDTILLQDDRSAENPYLDTALIRKQRIRGRWLVGIDLVILILFASTLLGFLLIPLLIRRIMRLRYASLAEEYGALFFHDEDGYMLFSDISQALKIPKKRIGRDLRKMLQIGFIRDVICIDADPGCVLLAGNAGIQWNIAHYIPESKVRQQMKETGKLISCCLLFFIVFLFYTVAGIFIPAGPESDGGVLAFNLILLVITSVSFYGLICNYRNRACLRRTDLYNQELEESAEGTVPIARMAERAKIGLRRAKKDFVWLLKNGFLKDCRLELLGGGAIHLADVQRGEALFVAMTCPGCGNTERIRAGRIGKCRFCGSFLTAPLRDTADDKSPADREDDPVRGGEKSSLEAMEKSDVRAEEKHCSEALDKSLIRSEEEIPGLAGEKISDTNWKQVFLDEKAMGKMDGRSAVMYLVGGFLTVEAVIGLSLAVGLEFDKDLIVLFIVVLAIPGILLLLMARRYSRICYLAEFCVPIFGQLRENTLTWEELAGDIGWTPGAVKRKFSRLSAWNVMKNCRADGRGIVLTDPSHRAAAYVKTSCKNCGAEITLKRGFVSVCRYCGAFVDEWGITYGKKGNGTPVILQDIGPNRGAVLAYLREMMDMPIPEIEELVASLPATVARTWDGGAVQICEDLRRLGASADVTVENRRNRL